MGPFCIVWDFLHVSGCLGSLVPSWKCRCSAWVFHPHWEPPKLFQPRLSLTRFLRLGEGTEHWHVLFHGLPQPTFSHVITVGDALLVNRTAALPVIHFIPFFSYTPSFLSLPLPLSLPTLNPLASPVGCTFKCLLLVPCPHSCPTIIYSSHSSPRRFKKITASQPSVSAASEAFQVTGIERKLLSLPSKALSDLASSFILPTAPGTLPSHSCLGAFPLLSFLLDLTSPQPALWRAKPLYMSPPLSPSPAIGSKIIPLSITR